MKFYLYFFFSLLLFSVDGFSQEPNKITSDKAIGASCFFSGSPTPIMKYFSSLIDDKNYDKIKSELFSSKTTHQFLSSLILEELLDNEIVKITNAEKNRLEKVKKSDKKILICSGCTYLNEISIREFFKTKNYQILLSIKNRIKK